MKEKECKLVQDLLPNYIEKLTSDETNQIIEQHLEECLECRNILEDMQKDINLKSKEQCQKETKYMKKYNSKLKIFKLLGIIFFIIIITFAINTTRKYIILNDLYNKAQIAKIQENNNYYAVLKAIRADSICYIEQYKLNEKSVTYVNKYTAKENNRNIFKSINYNSETENFSLVGDEINKEKTEISDKIYNLEMQDLVSLSINSLDSIISSKVKKITYEEKECYLIQYFGQELIVEADTGTVIRLIDTLSNETLIMEYFIEFDTVQENDVVRPDTTGYVEK